MICAASTYLLANKCSGVMSKRTSRTRRADETHKPRSACGRARAVAALSFDRRWASPVRPNVSRFRRHASETKALPLRQTWKDESAPRTPAPFRCARARTLTPIDSSRFAAPPFSTNYILGDVSSRAIPGTEELVTKSNHHHH